MTKRGSSSSSFRGSRRTTSTGGRWIVSGRRANTPRTRRSCPAPPGPAAGPARSCWKRCSSDRRPLLLSVHRRGCRRGGKRIGAQLPGDPPAQRQPLSLRLDSLPPAPAADQVHCFRTHLSLNRYRFLSEENVLGLGRTTEMILARCQPPGSLSQREESLRVQVEVVGLQRLPGQRDVRAQHPARFGIVVKVDELFL